MNLFIVLFSIGYYIFLLYSRCLFNKTLIDFEYFTFIFENMNLDRLIRLLRFFVLMRKGLARFDVIFVHYMLRRSLSYRNESNDLLCKSVDSFLYDCETSVMKELMYETFCMIWYYSHNLKNVREKHPWRSVTFSN